MFSGAPGEIPASVPGPDHLVADRVEPTRELHARALPLDRTHAQRFLLSLCARLVTTRGPCDPTIAADRSCERQGALSGHRLVILPHRSEHALLGRTRRRARAAEREQQKESRGESTCGDP